MKLINPFNHSIIVSVLILFLTLIKGVIFGIGEYDWLGIVIPIFLLLPLGVGFVYYLYKEKPVIEYSRGNLK